MATLPFALTGGFWLLYLLGYNQSVATAVGFIARAGVSAEFGVVMLIYLKGALEERPVNPSADHVDEALREGALLRVRPTADRKSGGEGQSVSVRVDLGGRRTIKKKKII